MISPDLRFDQFIEAMRGRNFADVLEAAVDEDAEAQRAHRNVRNRRMFNNPALRYSQQLGGFIFFLRNGVKPGGLSDDDFQLIRPLCEAWIARGQMLDGVLRLFQQQND